MARILLVEDEIDMMPGYLNGLRRRHDVTCVTNGSDALTAVVSKHADFDLVILDLMLPPGEATGDASDLRGVTPYKVGEVILKKMSIICPDKPIIVVTATRTNSDGLTILSVFSLLTKPVKPARLYKQIDELLESRNIQTQSGING